MKFGTRYCGEQKDRDQTKSRTCVKTSGNDVIVLGLVSRQLLEEDGRLTFDHQAKWFRLLYHWK
jgi:hypothetical protein